MDLQIPPLPVCTVTNHSSCKQPQIMARAVSHPEAATFNRSLTIRGLVERVFSVTCSHLSRLGDGTIEEYCKAGKAPKYIVRFFNPNENQFIQSKAFEKFDAKLSFKFLKTCCGLKEHKHERWSPAKHKQSAEEKDTFEYLIGYCWNEYDQILRAASSLTDDNLNDHMDKILEALLLLIGKVEEEKNVNEASLKSELKEHIGKKLDSYSNYSHSQHKYIILSEHLLHQMLVMVYNHLNRLHGMSLCNFLNNNKMNLVPRTGFSNERKFLEGNPPPEKMPIKILYQVVKRVCFNYEKRRTTKREELLEILHNLKEEYKTPLRNEEEYSDRCYKLYGMLETAFHNLCTKTGKEMKQVIGKLARETFVVEHIQKPFELPDSSPKKSDSPEESSASVTTPLPVLTCPSAKKGELSIEEVNICVLFRVVRPGGLISQTLAHVFKALKGNLENTQKNKSIFKNNFTGDEKSLINKLNDDPAAIDTELSKKDITFLCKLLRYGCLLLSKEESAWSINSNNKDTIEYNITVVRKERNKFAHEVTCIKTEDLNIILNTVRNALHTILEKTKTFLKDHECDIMAELQKHQNEMDSEMQKISQITYDLSLNNEWKEVSEMRDKVILTAQKELKQLHLYGEDMQNMSPITGSTDSRHKALTIEALFMERQLEDKDDVNAGVRGTYKVEDILFCHTSTLGSFRVFIIPGRPGDGKTSICKYLFHLWSQDIAASSLKGVDLLFYIPCRYVTIKSLSAYLKGKLPKSLGKTKNEDIVPLLQEPQVLFVIDGYDEAGEEAKGLIDEILTSLPDSKMIITTKTQWAAKLIDKVQTVTFNYKVLRIEEMTEDMRKQYVKKFFIAMKQDTEDCNKFLRYLDEMKENLNTLIIMPLTFSLLALLWINEPANAKEIRTLTQLYYKLINLIIKRVSKQLLKDDFFLFRDWVIKLGEIAWNNLKKKRHYLNEPDQMSLYMKARHLELGSEGYNHLMSSLLYCEIHESLVTDEKKIWTFTFTSQQEYFAAEYIVYEISQNKATSLKSILELSGEVNEKYKKKLQRLIPVIEFICGLLIICDGLTERLEEITEIMSIKEPWAFISLEKMFEHMIQENKQVKDMVRKMFMNEKLAIFHNYDPKSTLWVLNNTSLVAQKEVTVLSNVNDLPQILPILNFLLSESCKIKVLVDVDKVSNISKLTKLIEDEKYKHVRFFLAPWKPLCISEVIMSWTFNTPLYLSLCPEVFPLVWWKLLMCFLTMDKKVNKVICSPTDPKCLKLIEEGASTLKAELIKDFFLMPTEIVIHV